VSLRRILQNSCTRHEWFDNVFFFFFFVQTQSLGQCTMHSRKSTSGDKCQGSFLNRYCNCANGYKHNCFSTLLTRYTVCSHTSKRSHCAGFLCSESHPPSSSRSPPE
jgi:hypothetical protein